ncbi:MAG: sulfurtransferase TusA [Proteobacteria bacterium]|jgi:tRNA 2-thiouridine synthesizing protein A|nr:sulfurtransferase TusA [Pseudomonadota bacterium]MDA0957682.1 sulfurtransferase TusA [Pseudomonadota bacterium]MDA1207794.1 sulfurtransferase TusA [Pseudomonadota bacterium]
MVNNADYELDTKGLRCPEPLMMLRNQVRSMSSGEVIKVIATDPSTSWDFENFCRFMNHEMLAKEEADSVLSYWIRKG